MVFTRYFFLLCPLVLTADPIDYVTNGGFETGATSGVLSPSVPGAQIYVFGVGGATNIGGWTVTNSSNNNGAVTPLSVLVTGNPPQPPAGGNYAVDFDPFWNVLTGALLGPTVTGTLPELSQVLTLPSGSFLLSFEGAVEQGGTSGQIRPLEVTLTGAASLDQTVNTSEIDSVGYTQYTFGFTSTGGNVTLSFIPNDYSPEPNFMLDNVSVTGVPEPGYAVPVLSILLVIIWRRRYSLCVRPLCNCLPCRGGGRRFRLQLQPSRDHRERSTEVFTQALMVTPSEPPCVSMRTDGKV